MTQSSFTALVCESLSDDLSGLSLRSLPLAPPGPGQVRVKIRAAALNFPDYLMTQGRYQFKPDLPFVPGLEAAGEVDAIGTGVTVMDAVAEAVSMVALIVVEPGVRAATKPVVLTVATATALLSHVTVRPVSGLPEASFGVAVNWVVWPTTNGEAIPVNDTDATAAGGGGGGDGAVPPPQATSRAAMGPTMWIRGVTLNYAAGRRGAE